MASPSKSKHRGPTYILVPPLKPMGPMNPLGPQSELDSLSGFRASWDGLGPSGQIRTPQDKPGPSRTNQDPAERIRAPLDQPEPCGVKQGPVGRVRAPQKKKSTNWDISGPCGTN